MACCADFGDFYGFWALQFACYCFGPEFGVESGWGSSASFRYIVARERLLVGFPRVPNSPI